MKTFEISVKDKIAALTNREMYVCGNSDFVVNFSFDSEWDAYDTKTARFAYKGTYQDQVFQGNRCPVPIIHDAQIIMVGVFAGNLHTTTAACIGARRSILSGSGIPADPAPDVYAQIMELIQELVNRVNAALDSDDTTLDQMSEVVAYIKSNRTLIESITTSKVSVSDIIDNLTTNASNKPLSAAQGVALKALIDAISVPDKLPNPNALTFSGAVTGTYDGSAPVSVEIPQDGSWNELKDKPFYLEKTLVIALTKDDFTVNDQDGRFKYMYRSTPKLDWFTSAESIAFEIEIVDTNGRRYTATQDSIDVSFGNDTTDDDREYWYCYSNLFEIVSGVDLDYYDDYYYYKDEWGVLVNHGGIEFSEINIKIYRVDVKKIPKICLDAEIGKTAITVGSVLEDSDAEMSPSVIVPDLSIPVNPTAIDEGIYFDMNRGLRISGNLLPYLGVVKYSFPYPMPTTAGASISFDISSEGDTLWDRVGWDSPWNQERYLLFDLMSNYSGGGRIRFLSYGSYTSLLNGAVAASNLGRLYTVVFKYTNDYKTLNVTLKCVVE